MNFDKRDETFAELALDKAKRDKHIAHLSKARKRSWPFLVLSLLLSTISIMFNPFEDKVELLPILLFMNSIIFLISAMSWESEIRTLKLIDALQAAQPTEDNATRS